MGMGGGDSGDDDSSAASTTVAEEVSGELEEGKIGEARMITRMFASFGNNDLAALKTFLDSDESGIDQYASSVFYEYAVTPQIFDSNTEGRVRQVNPDKSFASLGIGSGSSTNSIMSMSMSTDVFEEMSDSDVIKSQYDVKAGHWPEKENELVLVLSQTGRINDFLSYVLGLRDSAELEDMVKKFTNEEEVETPDTTIDVSYDDILGMKFKLAKATDYYHYDEEHGVWVDKSGDEAYMRDVVNNGEDLEIVGIVQGKPEANALALTMGIYYTADLVDHIVAEAADSQIVKDQLANPKVDVFSGKSFDEEDAENESSFDMGSLFSVDEEALASAFAFDEGAFDMSSLDFSSLDFSSIQADPPDLSALGASLGDLDMPEVTVEDFQKMFPNLDLAKVVSSVDIRFTDDGTAVANLVSGFASYATEHRGKDLRAYFDTKQGKKLLNAALDKLDVGHIEAQVLAELADQLGTKPDDVGAAITNRLMERYGNALAASLQEKLGGALVTYMTTYLTAISNALSSQMGSVMQSFSSAMHFDTNAFANAFQFNMSEEDLAELLTSMMRVEEHSYDNNLKKLGYADFAKPSEISIYPRDFEGKEHIIEILDGYNDRMRQVDEDKVISYTDIVGTLMESVTTIVNMISAVLIAFVAISLIVSSIMIGVITYISVLERKKEIGILRSIGASKGDISRVFNAETVIEGLIAGLLGVGVTALGCIPANIIVYQIYDVPNVALLPVSAAAILVLISVVLTFVAGLIPSGSASRKDPVEALRSE